MQSAQAGVSARLVNCFFEGVSRPQRFAEGLRLLAEMLKCDQVSIKFWDRRGSWACLRKARRVHRGWQLLAEDLPAPQSDWIKLAASLEPVGWNRVSILPAKRAEDAAATGRSSSAYLMCLRLSTAKGADGLLLVQHSKRAALAGSEESDSLQLPEELLQTLTTALELMAQFRQLNHRASCASALLDTIRMPLLMVDHSLRLLAANRHAQPLIERVTLGSGKRCIGMNGLSESRFSAAVQNACHQSSRTTGSVLLTRSEGKPASQVLVLPLLIRHAGKPERVALILVHGQHEAKASGHALLQQAYSLTPAEARLAMLILEGHSPGDAATSLQVSVATIRTQLSAILKKTGTRKQAELVRRLAPLLVLDRQHATH